MYCNTLSFCLDWWQPLPPPGPSATPVAARGRSEGLSRRIARCWMPGPQSRSAREEAAVARTKRLPVLGTSIEAGPLPEQGQRYVPCRVARFLQRHWPTAGKRYEDRHSTVQISGYSVAQLSLPLLQQRVSGLGSVRRIWKPGSARAQAGAVTSPARRAQVRSLYFQIRP